MIDLAVHCFIRLPINSKSLEMSNMAKSNAARFAAMKAAEINAKLMAKGIPIKQEVLPIKQKVCEILSKYRFRSERCD